jgi:hypothetical protein
MTMPEVKPISKEGIPNALEKATRYRLLNDPWQAESICRDILRADPGNQEAVMTLILATTDQFQEEHHASLPQVLELVTKLDDEYQAEYCRGLIHERKATAAMKRASPRAGFIAYEHLRKAMEHYTHAEKIRPATVEDAILRWNSCVRMIQRYNLAPSTEEREHLPFLE